METPDWKIESEYDYVDQLSPSALAFEFLRRNSLYQAAYQEYTTKIENLIKELGLNEKTKNRIRSDPSFWKLNPEIKEGESLGDWNLRVMQEGLPFARTPLDYWYGEQWRLVRAFPDPSKQANNNIQFKPYTPYPEMPMFEDIRSYFVGEDPFPQKLGSVVLAFNLQYPLTTQTDRAKILLSSLKKELEEDGWIMFKQGINKPGKFKERKKEYLRAFDGSASGATNIEIGDILFPELPNTVEDDYERSQAAYARINQAKSIVDQAYEIIPFINLT